MITAKKPYIITDFKFTGARFDVGAGGGGAAASGAVAGMVRRNVTGGV
tara:strand:- start:136 stop:279 length:144 start_codon:yes stop_codon:yes gene_type:complete